MLVTVVYYDNNKKQQVVRRRLENKRAVVMVTNTSVHSHSRIIESSSMHIRQYLSLTDLIHVYTFIMVNYFPPKGALRYVYLTLCNAWFLVWLL